MIASVIGGRSGKSIFAELVGGAPVCYAAIDTRTYTASSSATKLGLSLSPLFVEAAMKYARWFILPILCLDVSLLYAAANDAQPFPKELIDPAFLRQLTWRTDKRLEHVVSGWPTYSGDQGFQDRIVHRRTRVRILESLFDAEYRTYKNKAEAEILIHGGAGDVTDDCDALLTWIKRALGRPEKIVDLSRESGTEIYADWLFGDSRMRFQCLAPEFIPLLIALHYNHRERLAALEDPIHLECSVQQKYVGLEDAKVSEEPPLLFIVDPNLKMLRWSNKSSFGKTETFTNEKIAEVREDEKTVSRIAIDRVTANYLRTIRLKNGRGGLDQWGKCIRVAPGKKF